MKNAPSTLGKNGKQLWKELGPVLLKAGRLNPEDKASFMILCSCYDEICLSNEAIKKDGVVINDGRKSLKRHPAIVIKKDAIDAFTKLMSKFGLSALDRKKLNLPMMDPKTIEAENDLFGGRNDT